MIGPNITHRPHFRLARTAAGLAAALALVVLALTQSSKWRRQQRVKSLKGAAPAAVPAAAAAAAAVNGISGRALSTVEAGTAPGRLVRELIPRSGLPHVFSKARWDEGPVRVAFLGGSVTAKADCWRPQVMELLRSLYPSVEWAEINASLGGTGSLFGAFRVDRSVIAHKPDLLFIEYAANDRVATTDVRASVCVCARVLDGSILPRSLPVPVGSTPCPVLPLPLPTLSLFVIFLVSLTHTCTHIYPLPPPFQPLPPAEGVIRKIRRALPDCDMAIVYITTEALTQEYDLAAGRLPEVVQTYERLADHYDIPSVHLGLEIVERAAVGEVVWYGAEATATGTAAAGDAGAGAGSSTGATKAKYVFGTDGIHPHKGTGCAAYARAINRSLAALEEHARLPRDLLPAPLHPQELRSRPARRPGPRSAVRGRPEDFTGHRARQPLPKHDGLLGAAARRHLHPLVPRLRGGRVDDRGALDRRLAPLPRRPAPAGDAGLRHVLLPPQRPPGLLPPPRRPGPGQPHPGRGRLARGAGQAGHHGDKGPAGAPRVPRRHGCRDSGLRVCVSRARRGESKKEAKSRKFLLGRALLLLLLFFVYLGCFASPAVFQGLVVHS